MSTGRPHLGAARLLQHVGGVGARRALAGVDDAHQVPTRTDLLGWGRDALGNRGHGCASRSVGVVGMDDSDEGGSGCVEHAYVLVQVDCLPDGAWQEWQCVRCGSVEYGRPDSGQVSERGQTP